MVILEPTDVWSRIQTREGSILNLFYRNKTKYSLTFQTLICTSIRSLLERLATENLHIKHFIVERSLLSSRYVFAKMLLDEGSMTALEHKVYESLFLDTTHDWMNPSKMVYVKTSPSKCVERIKHRANSLIRNGIKSREGERLISSEYLENCAIQHEQHLFSEANIDPIVVDGDEEDEMSRQKIIEDLYKSLLGHDIENDTKCPHAHVHSARLELAKSRFKTEQADKDSDDDTLSPEEILISGIAEVTLQEGRAVRSIDPTTGAGTVTLTASINNPEILSWLSNKADKYELTLRPIPIEKMEPRALQYLPYLRTDNMVEKPRIIALEGNIGSGKTTLINSLKTYFQQVESHQVIFLDEPIDLWNEFQLEGKSLLELYYAQPKEFSFIFQVMAYSTLGNILRRTIKNAPANSTLVCEKSLISAQYVCVKCLEENNFLTDIQRKVLHKLFREEGVRDITESDIIYLHTTPEQCEGKISRKDSENNEVITLEYLTKMHILLEDLFHSASSESSLRISKNLSTEDTHALSGRLETIAKFITTKKRKLTEYITSYSTYPEIVSIEGNTASGKTNLLRSISR